MSAPKTSQVTKAPAARAVPSPRSPRKKARAPRARLVHIEVRRGNALCLRLAIADGVKTEAGDELGALIKRISSGAMPIVPLEASSPDVTVIGPDPGLIVTREHGAHDAAYHAELREHLVNLFGSLCDSALEDALDIARKERDRRAEGAN